MRLSPSARCLSCRRSRRLPSSVHSLPASCVAPSRRLLVTTRGADEPYDEAIEATLTADGDQTILVIEARGRPLDLLAAYGAGYQIHAENLAAHLAGRERVDSQARWAELAPSYEDLAANIG
jgi:hypothetical protein